MSKNLLVNGKAVPASTKSTLVIEEFLMEYYRFRQNILNGKVEFSTKQSDGTFGPFEPLTQKALNAIILRAKEDEKGKAMNPKQLLEMIHKEYPSLVINHSAKVHLGFAMKELGYDFTERAHVHYYKVVPLTAA